MYKIKRYIAECAAEWDVFVPQTRNGTFLFMRSYMDYHADRFCDHSLMIYRKEKLCALLPANESGNILYSHGGLTYGSLLTLPSLGAVDVCDIFTLINKYLKENGFCEVIYKAIPWIYHRMPAEEDLYALFKVCNARLIKREISSTIVYDNQEVKFTESRRSGIRKAERNGIIICETDDMVSFWQILNDNLAEKYNAKPVHSLGEIQLLKSRFPSNIRLFMAHSAEGCPLGGSVIYENHGIAHTQYISASPKGKQQGALDLLFQHVINNVFAKSGCKYFDIGTSTLEGGHILNEPLIFQKEGFGGRGVCYDTYKWEIDE